MNAHRRRSIFVLTSISLALFANDAITWKAHGGTSKIEFTDSDHPAIDATEGLDAALLQKAAEAGEQGLVGVEVLVADARPGVVAAVAPTPDAARRNGGP